MSHENQQHREDHEHHYYCTREKREGFVSDIKHKTGSCSNFHDPGELNTQLWRKQTNKEDRSLKIEKKSARRDHMSFRSFTSKDHAKHKNIPNTNITIQTKPQSNPSTYSRKHKTVIIITIITIQHKMLQNINELLPPSIKTSSMEYASYSSSIASWYVI